MQEEMRRYGDRMRTQGQTPLQVRVGVNTGEVVVRSIQTGADHTEYTPISHSTGLAARLQTLATPGTMMISGFTRRFVEGFFQLKSFGPTRLKGVTEQVEVYEVTGLGPLRTRLQRAAARGLTKFVGRQREMEALQHAAEQAQTGHGQIVAVMADPGVGKSRLFYGFKAAEGGAGTVGPAFQPVKDSLERLSHMTAGRDACPTKWMVLEALSVSHGKASAYLPVLDLLSQYFELSRDDDERKRRELILGKVLGLDRTLEETLPYLYSLQAIADTSDSLAQMDPQIRRRRTLDAIKRILLRESINQPLMLIFEDLHWIDSETQALLNLLVDAIANARILLLVNYRPEYRHEWGNRMHYSQLRLDPLGHESAAEMLSALLGDEPELASLKRLIANRTEGNPFFVEETVQALFEQGVLVRNGQIALKQPLATIKIPPTVQALLASRIDRLPTDEKELLQTLSVMGREFRLPLIRRVVDSSEAELERMLSNLQSGEFIYEQPVFPDPEYTFKHALTQEVAYNSVLTERRKFQHERTAAAMESLYADRLDDHLSELARHYRYGVSADKALRYAQLAAEQALSRGAYPETAGLIETALKLLDKLPEGNQRLLAELALRTIESTLAYVMHGAVSQERERAIRRMCELGEQLGERDQLLRGLIALAIHHWFRGELLLGQELAKRNLDLAETTQDARLLVEAHYNAGMLAFSCGNLRQALTHLDDAQRHASAASLDDKVSPLVGILCKSIFPSNRAISLQLLGWPDEALKSAEQGLRHARDSRHLFSLIFALIGLGSIFWGYRREPESALVQAEEGIALSEENGFSNWLNWGQFTQGWALAELGQPEQGIAEMEAAVAGFRGGQAFQQYRIALLAQAYARTGRTGEALTMLNETLAHIERTGEKLDHAEMLRLNGEVLLMHDRSAAVEAENCFHAGLAVARAQEAKWWELRTTVSLARLLRDTNRRDQARTMLGEIYNWFTEGFDLPDLKDAKSLLDELGGSPL